MKRLSIKKKLITKKPEAAAKISMITAKKKLAKIGVKKSIRRIKKRR